MRNQKELRRADITFMVERRILQYLYTDPAEMLTKLIHKEIDNIAKNTLPGYSSRNLYFIRQFDQNYFSKSGDHDIWKAIELPNIDNSKTVTLCKIGNMLTIMLKEKFIVANYIKGTISNNMNLNLITKFFPDHIKPIIEDTLESANYPDYPSLPIAYAPSMFVSTPVGAIEIRFSAEAMTLMKQRIFQNELIDKM